jgi:hypothetical protein
MAFKGFVQFDFLTVFSWDFWIFWDTSTRDHTIFTEDFHGIFTGLDFSETRYLRG